MPDEGFRGAVVGGVGDNEPISSGRHLADPHGKIIRLTAGTRERDGGQLLRHRREQALGELNGTIRNVTSMCIEYRGLFDEPRNDLGMAMTDDRHIVVGVEVTPSIGVVQPDTFAANDMNRFLVEQSVRRRENPSSTGQCVIGW